jgi:hypothetical protein
MNKITDGNTPSLQDAKKKQAKEILEQVNIFGKKLEVSLQRMPNARKFEPS